MINKIFKVIMIFITSIIVLVMIVSQLLLRDALAPFKFAGYLLTYKYANYDINKKNDILERKKKVENDKAIKTYIINKYGEVLSQVIEVEYRGRRKGWHADSEYVLHFPFANDKVVYVESETQKIFTRDYDISTDVKFQHLYSEWVKKQVGIEDENVELKFAGNYDPPYIEFNKITSLSEDYREVFENTHNYKLENILIKNVKKLSYDFFINYSESFVNKNYKKMLSDTPYLNIKNFSMSLFSYNFNMSNPNYLEFDKYFNKYGEEPNNYTCRVSNGIIQDKIYYSYKDLNNKIMVVDTDIMK